jgi:hypothetical protein
MGELILKSENEYAYHHIRMIDTEIYCKRFHIIGDYLTCREIITKKYIESDEPRECFFEFGTNNMLLPCGFVSTKSINKCFKNICSELWAEKTKDVIILLTKNLKSIKAFKDMEDWMLTEKDALIKAKETTRKQNIKIKEEFNINVISISRKIARFLNENKRWSNFKTYKEEGLIDFVTKKCLELKDSSRDYISINPYEF